MKVDQHTKLTEIQETFNKQFPHLRIEFYGRPHDPGEGTSDRDRLDHERTLGDVTKPISVHQLQFDGNMTINALESKLNEELGLHAQVFRRSGNLWLQTTATDNWTLDDANRKGGHSEELFEEQQRK